jgi:high-affinity Fe2+/Pb2+ permease
MLEPRSKSGGLRLVHGVVVTAAVVVAAIVTWVVFSFVLGIFFKLVELVIVIALVAAVVHLVRRHSRRGRS